MNTESGPGTLRLNISGRTVEIVLWSNVVPPNYYAAPILDYLRECRCNGASVLDLGCGTGVLAIAAYAAGADRVIGIDISPAAVSLSELNWQLNDYPYADSVFLCRDLRNASLVEKFDLIVCNPPQTPVADDVGDPGRSGGESGLDVVLPAIECGARHLDESGAMLLTAAEFLERRAIDDVARQIGLNVSEERSVLCWAGTYTRRNRAAIERNGFLFREDRGRLGFMLHLLRLNWSTET